MDAVFLVTLLLVVAWRASHPEATAPDDPFLWAIAALIVTWRVVWRPIWRRAAAWDKAHEDGAR